MQGMAAYATHADVHQVLTGNGWRDIEILSRQHRKSQSCWQFKARPPDQEHGPWVYTAGAMEVEILPHVRAHSHVADLVSVPARRLRYDDHKAAQAAGCVA